MKRVINICAGGLQGSLESLMGAPQLTKESYLQAQDMKLPLVGLGTREMTTEEIEDAVMSAIRVGYRHIDTAYEFGNEEEIGDALRKVYKRQGISRDKLFITAKVPVYGMRPNCIHKYLYESLEKLWTPYVDLYMLPFPAPALKNRDPDSKKYIPDLDTDLHSAWEAMENLVYAGLAKSIGVCNFNKSQLKMILSKARIPPTNAQIEMHAYHQQPELRQFCQNNRITVTALAPLGSSVFQKNPPLSDGLVKRIAKENKKEPSQILLRYLLQLGVAVIPKSVEAKRIEKNIEIFDFALNENEMKEMSYLDQGEKGRIYKENLWKGLEDHPQYPFKT